MAPTMPARQHALTPVLLFVLALLLAQTLGHVHRMVHRQVAGLQAPAVAKQQATGFLGALFQHNDNDPSCRLYDQCGSPDAVVSVPAIAVPVALPSGVLLYFTGEALARWVALFDARGPPSIR